MNRTGEDADKEVLEKRCGCDDNRTNNEQDLNMTTRRFIVFLTAFVVLTLLQTLAGAQSLAVSGDSHSVEISNSLVTTRPRVALTYIRPTERTKLHNYFFDTFGPYPIVGAAFAAGINQEDNTPPEWRQGAEAYGKRFGSAFAIAGVSTTTRYALARTFGEDTVYYRCDCGGFLPRLRHAAISTFTSRRGDDGHHVFSVPAVVAPYAGTMTAVYAWYPGRLNAKDGFRMGNYSLLGYAAGNIALEFLYSGPHLLLSRMHLNNEQGATDFQSHGGPSLVVGQR
jgi:hypothetical protein